MITLIEASKMKQTLQVQNVAQKKSKSIVVGDKTYGLSPVH